MTSSNSETYTLERFVGLLETEVSRKIISREAVIHHFSARDVLKRIKDVRGEVRLIVERVGDLFAVEKIQTPAAKASFNRI